MKDWLGYLLVATILVLLGLFALVGAVLERKRRDALRRVADLLNLSFDAAGGPVSIPDLARFSLFLRGHSRQARNCLFGRTNGVDLEIFEYQYVTGGGKHRRTHRQTVAVFAITGPPLPDFDLRPAGLFDKLAAVFGHEDINFPEEPAFSAKYTLRGIGERAVRALFDGRVIEAVAGAGQICIAGSGSRLLVYRAGQRVPPDEISAFVETGCALHAAFAAIQNRARQ